MLKDCLIAMEFIISAIREQDETRQLNFLDQAIAILERAAKWKRVMRVRANA